jgi:hypothetical protein
MGIPSGLSFKWREVYQKPQLRGQSTRSARITQIHLIDFAGHFLDLPVIGVDSQRYPSIGLGSLLEALNNLLFRKAAKKRPVLGTLLKTPEQNRRTGLKKDQYAASPQQFQIPGIQRDSPPGGNHGTLQASHCLDGLPFDSA